MGLTDGNNGGLTAADVAAVTGNNNGFGGWGDGSFWIIVLFLFALMGNWGGVSNGFANAEISRCNAQTNLLQTMANNQAATMQSFNDVGMAFQNCCCDNRLAVAETKQLISAEAAATRANTDAKVQAVMDKLCQLEMDGIKQNYENRIAGMQNEIDALRSTINTSDRLASQNAQTAQILADNAAQTNTLEQYLMPTPRPAWIVQNPNCCQPNYGCGCGCNA